MNPIEKIIHYFKKNHIDYMILYHEDQLANSLQNETHIQGVSTINSFDIPEIDMYDYIQKSRDATRISRDHLMLMAIAWVLPKERQLFQMFPETFLIDCTFHTNNEKRPLLTLTGKDRNSKTFTFLRAFLPNEQLWVFNWIFTQVLPKMFDSIMQDVKLIISDGDSQEMAAIDNAISMHYPKARRARCGWHIIDRGWHNHMMGYSGHPRHKLFFKQVEKL